MIMKISQLIRCGSFVIMLCSAKDTEDWGFAIPAVRASRACCLPGFDIGRFALPDACREAPAARRFGQTPVIAVAVVCDGSLPASEPCVGAWKPSTRPFDRRIKYPPVAGVTARETAVTPRPRLPLAEP
jgi:hypothetical protein